MVFHHEIGMRGCLSWTLQCLGYPDEARLESLTALETGRQLGHAYSLAQALWFEATCRSNTVSLEAALPVFEKLQNLADEHGFAFYKALATMFRGWSYRMLGDPKGGFALMRQGLQHYVDTDHRLYLSSFLRYQSELLGHAGQPDEGCACWPRGRV